MSIKNKIIFFVIFFVILFGLYTPNIFAQTENTTPVNIGFVPGNIWYSQDPFMEGDLIKIYTLVFNNGKNSISGTVEFYDKNVILGDKKFTLKAGEILPIYVDWKVTAGDHTMSAKIIDSKMVVNNTTESIVLKYSQTDEDERFVPKIIPASEKITDQTNKQIEKVTNFVSENTPASIKEPVISTTKSIEAFRTDTAEKLATQKESTQKEIEAVDEKRAEQLKSNGQVDTSTKIEKPLKYIKLFLISLFAFIFKTKVIFYLLALTIIFLIFRFIFKKIFKKKNGK
ncbi:MAG: hypothetical protein WDK96_00540 [Candidatus Paceibacterota bacterium]|jgi:hypothetical protein